MSADREQRTAEENERTPRFSPRADGDAWAIISYLLGGPIVWGGAGWLLDSWLGTGFFLPAGLLVGMAAALYIVWIRYGKAAS
jgi:F0F1-type ATP synthase assembly protein I